MVKGRRKNYINGAGDLRLHKLSKWDIVWSCTCTSASLVFMVTFFSGATKEGWNRGSVLLYHSLATISEWKQTSIQIPAPGQTLIDKYLLARSLYDLLYALDKVLFSGMKHSPETDLARFPRLLSVHRGHRAIRSPPEPIPWLRTN